ncbi:MAG: FapA family protein [Spirochaetaceae bacterium]|nr:FapA family protein [Spirochaetaceae bacterium]
MVSNDQIRQYMLNQIKIDKQKTSIHVTGKNIEDALFQGSIELGLPIRRLEYEILDKGKRGVFGMGHKNCTLIVYESEKNIIHDSTDSEDLDHLSDVDLNPEIETIDESGSFSLRLDRDGCAYLKVKPPLGKGEAVSKEEIEAEIFNRALTSYDIPKIEEVLRLSDNIYVKVGEFSYNPINDPLMTVEVSEDEMSASIYVSEPGPGGANLTGDDIKGFLKNNRIISGINEEKLTEFEESPTYRRSYLVAEGIAPVNGKDGYIKYLFNTDPNQIKLKIKDDGKVDFKELNIIQNVIKGQPLAQKIAPELGKNGKNIYGTPIKARDGKDIQIGLGKNVTIAQNGEIAVAEDSGQVMLTKGKISVETVMVIPGDVNTSTGNINGLGTVVIKGNVEDGFSVTAQGTIEVLGFVGKSALTSGADIVVKQGINGGEGDDSGLIKAQKSVWASFITNATVESGNNVIVSDGIVNSIVDANAKILCQGKRAKIVGGHVRAAEEVNAAVLGSPHGAETIIEVGYDPKTKEEIEEYEAKQRDIESKLDDLSRNIQGLLKQKKIMKDKFPSQKVKSLMNQKKMLNKFTIEKNNCVAEIERRLDYLESLKVSGKICASKTVHPGVKLFIKDAALDITNAYDSSVTFVVENGFITTTSYEEIEEDISRR